VSENKKVRIGVIGAGWWAVEVYVPALSAHPDVELVAVNRRNQQALDKITQTFGIAKGYTDYHELLAAEALDAAVIVSPHPVHFEQAKAALEAGAHVLVDKPMTTSAEEARALVALAAAKGLEIVVPYGWNFKDFTREAARLVAAGEIGEVRHVSCQMASPTRDLFGGQGLVETKDHMFRPPNSTWSEPDKAGGYGWGQLSHVLGLMFRVTGLAPSEVYAIGGQSPSGVDYYDAATVRCTNGASIAVSGAATVPKQCGYQVDVRVFGTEGMLLLDVERERMEVRRDDGRDTVMDIAAGAGAYQCIEPIDRLVEICLGTHADNEAPGWVGQRAVEVLEAMYRSFKSGKVESV